MQCISLFDIIKAERNEVPRLEPEAVKRGNSKSRKIRLLAVPALFVLSIKQPTGRKTGERKTKMEKTNTMENQNQGNNTAADTGREDQQQEKTFTQEEVNRIVQDRLARVKAAGSMDQREAALQERENALYAREAVEAAGLEKELAEELRGMDKETVDKIIRIVTPYAQKASEPIYNAVGPTGGAETGVDAIRVAMGLKR